MIEKVGRCHDCTAPQTEVNILSRHILELQADKGRLTDSVRELEEKLANADYQLEGRDLEIKELEQQIEKMKCCENCVHHTFWGDELKCTLPSFELEMKCLKSNKNRWEIKEK